MKDFKASGEASSPQKRTSITAKHEILHFFILLFGIRLRKNSKKNLDSYCYVTILTFFHFCWRLEGYRNVENSRIRIQ